MSYQKFKDFRENQKRRQQEAKDARERSNFNSFWMKKEEKTFVIFLDHTDAVMAYHQQYLPGLKRTDYFGCRAANLRIKATDEALEEAREKCILCHINMRLIAGPVHTVYKIAPHKDDNGNNHAGYKSILVPAGELYEYLDDKYDEFQRKGKGADFAGCIFKVKRTDGQKVPRVGNIWEFVGRGSLDQVKAKFKLSDSDMEPIDYSEVLQPMSNAELKSILQKYKSLEKNLEGIPF